MDADEPLVSVIVPIYNVERYLDQCVRSVLDQTLRSLELILVNDGSPDACGAMADRYAHEDDRVVAIHQANQGLSGARNTGLAAAQGVYVAFLDSDDFWEGTDSLARCVEALEARPETDVLFFDALRFYEATGETVYGDKVWDRERVAGVSNGQALHYMVEISDVRPSACTKLIRRRFLLENHLQFREGIFSEDVEWFLRLVTFQAKYDYLNLPLYMYRKNRQGSITNTIGRANVEHVLQTVLRSSRAALASDAEPQFKADYLSYCFYQYSIAMAFYAGLSKTDRLSLASLVSEGVFLAAYDGYARGGAVSLLIRSFGVQVSARVLHSFLAVRSFRDRRRR